MAYKLVDILEATIGAFSASIFFVALRSGSPFSIPPKVGLIITILWGITLYMASQKQSYSSNFIPNVAVTVVVAYFMTKYFGLLEDVNIFSLDVFGSALIVVIWIALPVALLFDKFNLKSVLARYHIRGK